MTLICSLLTIHPLFNRLLVNSALCLALCWTKGMPRVDTIDPPPPSDLMVQQSEGVRGETRWTVWDMFYEGNKIRCHEKKSQLHSKTECGLERFLWEKIYLSWNLRMSRSWRGRREKEGRFPPQHSWGENHIHKAPRRKRIRSVPGSESQPMWLAWMWPNWKLAQVPLRRKWFKGRWITVQGDNVDAEWIILI